MNEMTNKIIGTPLDRVDGPAKVTGQATYTADYRPTGKTAEGFIVEAAAAPGKIRKIDTQAAEASDGVIAVLTHHNAPKQNPYGTPEDAGRFTQSHAMLESDHVRHVGDPVALVIAETLEQARHAAKLVRVEVETSEGTFDQFAADVEIAKPDSLDGADEVDTSTGDFEKEFAASDVTVEASYFTGAQHSAAMEPHATVAEWGGDELTVHMAIQIVAPGLKAFANTLGIEADKVRILSPFVGGGFGSKLGVHNDAILAALGAKVTGRPVRVVQTRRNVFSNAPHRSKHRQDLKIGADASGKLKAISHDSLAAMARNYPFAEAPASPTRASYFAPAIKTTHRVVEADIPRVDSMRAPGEAIGTLTFETAIDEIAEQCGIDPVEFRLQNDADRDPNSGAPLADRRLSECIREGAKKFGWDGRVTPGSRREGNKLIGRGMASAIRPNFLVPAEAEVVLSANGQLRVRLDMTDIGTGTYTILTQVAAETLAIPVDQITVELGDSHFPASSGSGGSFGAASCGSAVFDACGKLSKLLQQRLSGKGIAANAISVEGDRVRAGGNDYALADLVDDGALTVKGAVDPSEFDHGEEEYSYGALFSEVEVDVDSGEIRVRRLLGAFDAGRILNEKTARSQLMGGMIFGIGGALLEESTMDTRYGSFMNRDFAEYHIAVNRDVPELEVHMLEGFSEKSNPLGSKGIGELGICGTGPAIANAIYEATGCRVRKFPIHMEDLLQHLPQS
ncbi:xanthine dehydrogenase family protein molybdopterin-binding subunit [Roseibium sp.]|uniref:xanthine dehydrogenase family protein molybdopterin-binding subunit n=1 Tax=Roseibium sp. TaxID=1936156 RepID=UPI003A981DED